MMKREAKIAEKAQEGQSVKEKILLITTNYQKSSSEWTTLASM
jgi:hypothetical protein